MLKNKKGITLIALVVTIIVLIILAGISVNLLLGENGILEKAKGSATAYEIGQRKEAVALAITTEFTKKDGDQTKMTVEGVLSELQKTQNSDKIYAVKEENESKSLITATEGNTSTLGTVKYCFPAEINKSAKTGIIVTVDSNMNITEGYTAEVEDAGAVIGNVEVAKAHIVLEDVWTNGVPSVTYEENTDANVTLEYSIGANGTKTALTGKSGTITDNNIDLGVTVYVYAVSNGKYSDAATIEIKDENGPQISIQFDETTQTSITITVTASDAKSGLANQERYTYYINNSIAPVESPKTNPTNDATFTYTGLTADTSYSLRIEAKDRAGNVKSTPPMTIQTAPDISDDYGFFDSNGNQLASWTELTAEPYYLNVENDYTYTSYTQNRESAGNSAYYVINNASTLSSGKFGTSDIKEVKIPGNTSTGSTNEFNKMVSLASTALPNGVLNNIKVAKIEPTAVTKIGDHAFYNCSGLTSVSIPNTVTSIGEYAFRECTNLTSATLPNNLTSIGQYAFYKCTSLTSLIIPNSVTSIGDNAFSICEGITSITIGNGLTHIGIHVFSNCSALTSLTIGSYVTSISSSAFYRCVGLTSVTIPNSVTSIADYAFASNYLLSNVTIENVNCDIHSTAFDGCPWQPQVASSVMKVLSTSEIDALTNVSSSVKYNLKRNANANSSLETNIKEVLTGGVPVPKGFYYKEGISTIIEGLTGDDAKNYGVVITDDPNLGDNGNEWVWIPVNSTESLAVENIYENYSSVTVGGTQTATSTGTSTGTGSGSGVSVTTKYYAKSILPNYSRSYPGDTSGYREPDLVSYDYDSSYSSSVQKAGFNDAQDMAERIVADYTFLIESIKKYGGFYVGRYELSGSTSSPTVKKDQTQLDYIDWYDAYYACRQFETSYTTSTMMWGTQWDIMCLYCQESGQQISYSDYDSDRHSVSSSTKTGMNENDRRNNIYDVEGSRREWTQEAGNYYGYRVLRGGDYSGGYSAANRVGDSCNDYHNGDGKYGARPTLYIR